MTVWNLRITDRRGRATTVPMTSFPVILGRDEKLAIRVNDPQASRRHCQIESGDGTSFTVRDLNSTNGTFLNGRKITRATVTSGDRIKIGETIIEFMKSEEVSVEDDTGLRRLSILKSVASPGKQASAMRGAPDDRDALLARIGVPGSAARSTAPTHQRLALIAEVGHILTELRDLEEILKIILSGLIEIYPIERVAVMMRNEESNRLEPSLSRTKAGIAAGVIVSRTICQHVLKTGEAIITEDALADPRFSSGDSIIEHRVGSVIAAPIAARGRLLGVLYACTSERAHRFSDQDLSFLALIGNLVALAILLDRSSA